MKKEIEERYLELTKIFGKMDEKRIKKIEKNIDKNMLDSIFKTKLNQGVTMRIDEIKKMVK